MQIKEVTARTGLTDRAIRLYIENGLVRPRQEFNYAGHTDALIVRSPS